jgi:pyruvate,water dikinase
LESSSTTKASQNGPSAGSTGPLVSWFDSGEGVSAELLGGKCLGLVEMTLAGLAVPAGFAVTTVAHRLSLETTDGRRLKSSHANEPEDGTEQSSLGHEVRDAIAAAYAELGRRAGIPEPPVAVRSSGQSEDSAGASFAGQYDTYLWVVGAEAVVDAVERVWQGSSAATVDEYRAERDFGPALSPMSVGVQLMVDARSAGVMFTLDPRNGDRSRVVIESSWGLGESVVAGEINPDRFSVDKVTRQLRLEEIGSKEKELRFDPESGRVARREVEASRRNVPSLSDEEVLELLEAAKHLEALRGKSQDVEWAIDSGGRLFFLQVRPETVWSSREQASVSLGGRAALDCVVDLFSGAARE